MLARYNCIGEMSQSTIKVLENSLSKLRGLHVEAVAKMEDCFTICQYKTKEPTNI